MLRDITLGQYFPISSIIHNLDPRLKIIFCFVLIALIFVASTPVSFAVITAFILYIIKLSKIKISVILKSIKPVLFLITFTAIINLFFTSGNDYIFKFSFIKISKQGLYSALTMSARVILLVISSSLLTFTTSPILLTDGIEYLLKPFSKIGFPSHELAMMITIALRFIPTLLKETDKIIMAQKARGADFESGNLIQRARSLVPILIPLFINSFRRADELATAMECRCYRGGTNRTRLRELHLTKIDLYASIEIFIFCIVIIYFGVTGI